MALDDPELQAALERHIVALAGLLNAELRGAGMSPADAAAMSAIVREDIAGMFASIVRAAAAARSPDRRGD